jgi:hypothetical protein
MKKFYIDGLKKSIPSRGKVKLSLVSFSPANNKRQDKGQYVIQIHIQFIISVLRLEQFDEEEVIEDNGNEHPGNSQKCKILE